MVAINKFTVKTLDNKGLQDSSIALNSLVYKDFAPDVIIGIRTGGFLVAEIMANAAANKPLLLAISRQRTSTQTKSKVKGLKGVLRSLPYTITDRIRILEHKFLNAKPKKEPRAFLPNIDELTALLAVLREPKNGRILIVDDAIDSGATMKAVLDVVRTEANSSCIIKTAAITVTTDTPIVKPDYALYNHVLCRFPWSFDFKD